ncbi:2-oxoacid:acceptor oxidoreductase family protein [Candidatus Parcubacteria bacterium]|nr:2-oxoacid:acceptor oxidoreductase family protein [Patescibacteria group bacterium]MBU4308906.1 2-oxoacid:acceptor oxidoreductase family protein [Patescibacteria group bacterium]MBU4432592.1 2-oxoacid:acceptor oxidoreductase family protein [Patescibacteria group bacterium]MBU4577266.1 2-oxoacid:acceptor oxidoreductase family protein [Patescibacteria group bacterium]MCG2696956.1 2-oxoacid:acceptor oxidoreductase family protein [Candidatus Parcubacteria bacterium]
MHQIRFHGRGGQGVVTAAELVAVSAFYEGWQAQAFPSFGVERTGAPIEAFARMDKKPIRTREHVQHPDILIIQDSSLIGTVDLLRGCGKDTIVIVNTTKSKDELAIDLPKENIFAIDATKIALEVLGRNIVNTVILGAFAKGTKLISLESLKKAITEKFGSKGQAMVDKNIKAIEEAYKL